MLSRWTALAWLLTFASAASAPAATRVVAGPMLGHASDTSARLWMQISTAERVTVKTFDVARNREMGAITLEVQGPPPFIFDGPLAGLEPDRNYRIEVLFDDQPVALPGPPVVVRTAPAPGEVTPVTVAFGSCLDPTAFPRVPLAKAIEAAKPRAFLFLGNAGYLPAKLDDFPATHREAVRFLGEFHKAVRLAPDLQGLFRTTPIYGVWGEHDFGTTDADRTFAFAKESFVAFQRYWPNPFYGTPETPGIFHSFVLGDAEFFLLDSRYYRDPLGDQDTPPKTMLGEGQLAWLKQSLKGSRATFKVIAGGSPMLPDSPPGHGWGRFKSERDEFMAWLFKNHISGVLFLSGGPLLGELSCRAAEAKDPAQYPLYELTSSPLAHALAEPEIQTQDNPLRVGELLSEINFGTLDFGGPESKRFVTFRLRDLDGKAKLERTVYAAVLRGQ